MMIYGITSENTGVGDVFFPTTTRSRCTSSIVARECHLELRNIDFEARRAHVARLPTPPLHIGDDLRLDALRLGFGQRRKIRDGPRIRLVSCGGLAARMAARGAQFGEFLAQGGIGRVRRIEGGKPRAGLIPSLGDRVERLRRLHHRWPLLNVRGNRFGINPGAARLRRIIGDGLR